MAGRRPQDRAPESLATRPVAYARRDGVSAASLATVATGHAASSSSRRAAARSARECDRDTPSSPSSVRSSSEVGLPSASLNSSSPELIAISVMVSLVGPYPRLASRSTGEPGKGSASARHGLTLIVDPWTATSLAVERSSANCDASAQVSAAPTSMARQAVASAGAISSSGWRRLQPSPPLTYFSCGAVLPLTRHASSIGPWPHVCIEPRPVSSVHGGSTRWPSLVSAHRGGCRWQLPHHRQDR